ncbi:5'/3'-nucleotidase SurE [Poseidonocella sp. HB161398]|uniref:5'/3'-nucleotidase SurE n=1 Tax=Poseidonocella sp. HB161398 TaxID=2320855 RepID=UPI00197D5E10|nr:5'/3'-nucleotidase SurE [Poseidonocella sp. HB161398]
MTTEQIDSLSFGTGAAFTLQLFHVSDQEANSTSVDVIPNFSAVLNALRAEDIDGDGTAGYGETLFLSSGDAWIPGLFHDASEVLYGQGGAADLLIQNLLGVEAIAFGNHEFDKGNAAIANILQGLDEAGLAAFDAAAFPYLSGNVDLSADPALSGLVAADGQAAEDIAGQIAGSTVVSTENGTRIGVVAATTPTLKTISSPSDETVVTPADSGDLDALAAEIQADVDALLAANPDIDKVIVLAHMQDIRIEQALATRLSGVDIIVAGGSNTRLFDGNDAGYEGDAAQGGYPYFATDADGKPIAVVNTDYQYKYVGRLVIDFDANGNIIPESYDPEISGAYATDDAGVAALGAEGMADTQITAIAEAVRDVIVAGESEWYAQAGVFLNGNRTGGGTDGVRTQETNLGNLTADANLAYAQGYDATVLVSIKNGGGIRDSIGQTVVPGGSTGEAVRLPNEAVPGAKPEGGISSNDIGNALAFDNGLTLVSLTTAELAAVLEHAVSNDPFTQEAGAGSFGQFGGLRFSFDPDAAPGSRVQNAVIVDDAGAVLYEIVRNGEIVDNGDASFRTVTLDYLAGGGDGYPFGSLSDPDIVNLYDLAAAADYDAVGSFGAGREQDALAEYLLAEYGTGADREVFAEADTVVEDDTRIQNLGYRATDTAFHDTSAKDGLTILLTNDDGYSAEGINTMYQALAEAGHTVYLVAPKGQNSGGGSTLGGTDALLSEIEIVEYEDGKWWVDGTPTAAVMAGLDVILEGTQIDLVISGTNEGENIGAFSNISGTVGAATEAISRDIPAIAVSAGGQVDGGYDGAYERAGDYVVDLIGQLSEAQTGERLLPAGTGLSVNVPSADPQGVAYTEITAEAPYMLGVDEVAAGNPAIYGLAVTAGNVTGGATSEVGMFLSNYLTVSAMDGNWTADAGARAAVEARVDVATEATAAPLKIVLTNDDGVGAEGIETLYDALVAAGHDVAVVAPARSQDGAGTGLTLSDFMVTEYSDGWFVDAAPSTVVGTALSSLMTGAEAPDLVLSGINDGALLGSQLRYSGTAGAIQAGILGFATPVISLAAENAETFGFASAFTLQLIADLQATAGAEGLLPEGTALSVNIPGGASFGTEVLFSVNDQASDARLGISEGGFPLGYGFANSAGLGSSDPLSEGEAYLDGKITVTVLDALYQADDAATDAIGDLLGMALGETAALGQAPAPLYAEDAAGAKLRLDAETGPLAADLGHANTTVAGMGDYDGDGQTDLLLRNDSYGWLKTLLASGEGAIIGNASNAVVAALDADGDGADELLMRHANGNYFYADAETGAKIGGLLRPGHDMFAAADMDGDGAEDILTVRPDGTLGWLDLAAGEVASFGRGAGTSALGLADLDGDGASELIVESGIGRTVALGADGATVAEFGLPGTLLATGDFVSGGGDELIFDTGSALALRDGTGALIGTLDGVTAAEFAGVHRGGADHADELVFDFGSSVELRDAGTGTATALEPGAFDRLVLADAVGFAGLQGYDIA